MKRPSVLTFALFLLVLSSPSAALCPPLLESSVAYEALPGVNDEALAAALTNNGVYVVVGFQDKTSIGQAKNWNITEYNETDLSPLSSSSTFNSPGNGDDIARGVATTGTNSFVVVGEGRVHRYTALGPVLTWSRTFLSAGAAGTFFQAVAIDSSGSIYVAGEESRGGGGDALLVKYDGAGTLLWSRTHGYGGSGVNDKMLAVATDAANNVIVAGYTMEVSAVEHWFVRKYTPGGTLSWSKTHMGLPANYAYSEGRSIAVDASGSIYVAGQEYDGLGYTRQHLVKYDPAGNILWTRSASPNSFAGAYAVRLDSHGRVIVVGAVDGFSMSIRRYDDAGTLLDVTPMAHDLAQNTPDQSVGMVIGLSNDIFLAPPLLEVGSTGDWYVEDWSQHDGCLTAALASPQLPIYVGEWREIRLTVTNPGIASVTGTMPLQQTDVGTALRTFIGGVNPPGPVALAAGSSTTFVWTYSVSGAGAISISTTGYGQDAFTLNSVYAGLVTSFTSVNPAKLATALSVPSGTVYAGQWASVRLTVTNTGAVSATLVVPSIQINTAATSVTLVSGPVPAGPRVIPAGSATTFIWTYSVSGAGVVGFTATASGVDTGTGWTITSSVTRAMVAQVASKFAASILLTPAVPYIGQMLTVRLTVTNTGTVNANALAPTLQFNGGAGLTAGLYGPSPAALAVLGPAGVTAFQWSMSVTGEGTILLTATATATDSGTGAIIQGAASGGVNSFTPATLAGSIKVTPLSPALGEVMTVELTVTNTGDASATGVLAALYVTGGGAALSAVAGPIPVGPVLVTPGTVQTFSWSATVVGAGLVTLTASASGTDTGLGGVVKAVTGAAVNTGIAEFATVVSVTPSPAVLAKEVRVTVQVTNTGAVPANGVAAFSVATSGGTLVALTAGPSPAGGVVLGPGASHEFVSLFAVKGGGTVTFTGSASGLDTGTSTAIYGVGTASVVITALKDTTLPDPGGIHVRNAVVDLTRRTAARIVTRGRTGGGAVTVYLYSQAGLALGKVGSLTLDADGLGLIEFDGRLGGKALAPGVYWIIATGAVEGRKQVLVVGE